MRVHADGVNGGGKHMGRPWSRFLGEFASDLQAQFLLTKF